MDQTRIQDAVISAVEDATGLDRHDITPDKSLLRELKMDGDAFSYIFVPRLEREFAIKTSQHEWANVDTVGDVVQLLLKHLNQRR